MLRRISEVYGLAVVVTNQVNEAPADFTGPFRHKPIGGNVMAHASKYRIRLRQFGCYRIAGLTVHTFRRSRYTLDYQQKAFVMCLTLTSYNSSYSMVNTPSSTKQVVGCRMRQETFVLAVTQEQ
jgi:hypothetical protein